MNLRAGLRWLAAGAPETVAAQTMDANVPSGLMAVATAAKQVMVDRYGCCRRQAAQEHLARAGSVISGWCRRRRIQRNRQSAHALYADAGRQPNSVAKKSTG